MARSRMNRRPTPARRGSVPRGQPVFYNWKTPLGGTGGEGPGFGVSNLMLERPASDLLQEDDASVVMFEG